MYTYFYTQRRFKASVHARWRHFQKREIAAAAAARVRTSRDLGRVSPPSPYSKTHCSRGDLRGASLRLYVYAPAPRSANCRGTVVAVNRFARDSADARVSVCTFLERTFRLFQFFRIRHRGERDCRPLLEKDPHRSNNRVLRAHNAFPR